MFVKRRMEAHRGGKGALRADFAALPTRESDRYFLGVALGYLCVAQAILLVLGVPLFIASHQVSNAWLRGVSGAAAGMLLAPLAYLLLLYIHCILKRDGRPARPVLDVLLTDRARRCSLERGTVWAVAVVAVGACILSASGR
jgi:hypothetical protein